MASPSWHMRLVALLLSLVSPLLGAQRARALVARSYGVAMMIAYTVRAQYGRAVFGVFWAMLAPLMFLAVYIPLFTYVFAGPADPGGDRFAFPLFVVAGFLVWNAFSEGLQSGASSLVSNMNVVRHSPAPPMTLPLVKVGTSFLMFLVGSGLLLIALAALGRFPGVRLVLFPVVAGLAATFTLGVSLLCAAVAVYVRDLLQILSTLLTIEFFACPLLYSIEMVPESWRVYLAWNPVTPFLALTRAALLPERPFAWVDLGAAVAWAGLALLLGTLVFRRLEAGFADAE